MAKSPLWWITVGALGGAGLGMWAQRRLQSAPPALPAVTARTAAAAAGPRADDQLAAAKDRITALVSELDEVTARHQIEFGRLESGALAALDESISQGQERERQLSDDLEQSREQLQQTQREADALRVRVETIQKSLAERDARVAELSAQLADERGRSR